MLRLSRGTAWRLVAVLASSLSLTACAVLDQPQETVTVTGTSGQNLEAPVPVNNADRFSKIAFGPSGAATAMPFLVAAQPAAALPLAAPAGAPAPAPAANVSGKCALTLETSVPMKPMAGGTVLAPVMIEKTPKLMLVDTGGFTSQLWESTARSFNLTERDGGVGLIDVNGNVSSKVVRVSDFRLGSLENRNLDFQVFPDAAVNLGDDEIAGLIAPSLFAGYDMDLDFGTNTLNTFSQDHCAGKIQYWSAPAATAIPFTLQSGHISIPVTIDGHRLNAIIDTGTSTTTITANAASAVFGFSTGTTSLGTMTRGNQPVIYQHIFSSLLLDGVSVGNPHINVMPDMTGNAGSGALPDVIIGMDVLRQLHVYIAFQEQKIYVSKTGPAKVM